jgi:hypothetical protein
MDGAYVYACDVTDFWTTVRIPLTAFQGVDLKRLQRVRFELLASDNGNTPVRALLDSVELVGHTSEPVCGNGDDEQGEQCDGADLGGLTCEDLGLISGVLACKDTCEFDTSGCEMPPVCGNGLREPGEQCDGPDLGGSTCEDFDLVSGTLACTNACEFDTSDCEQDDGDCPEGAPGCPGGPCLDIPHLDGRRGLLSERKVLQRFELHLPRRLPRRVDVSRLHLAARLPRGLPVPAQQPRMPARADLRA